MRIREYKDTDKHQILQLHVEFEREFYPRFNTEDHLLEENELEERYTYFIKQSGKFWVMEDQGVVVGYIGIKLHDDSAELIQLRVRKSHHRRGIGSLLIEKVEKYALEHGKKQIYLQTAEPLVKARKLYEKLGYTLTNTVEYSGFTVLAYIKNLII